MPDKGRRRSGRTGEGSKGGGVVGWLYDTFGIDDRTNYIARLVKLGVLPKKSFIHHSYNSKDSTKPHYDRRQITHELIRRNDPLLHHIICLIQKDDERMAQHRAEREKLLNTPLTWERGWAMLWDGSFLRSGHERKFHFPFSGSWWIRPTGPLAKYTPEGKRYWRVTKEWRASDARLEEDDVTFNRAIVPTNQKGEYHVRKDYAVAGHQDTVKNETFFACAGNHFQFKDKMQPDEKPNLETEPPDFIKKIIYSPDDFDYLRLNKDGKFIQLERYARLTEMPARPIFDLRYFEGMKDAVFTINDVIEGVFWLCRDEVNQIFSDGYEERASRLQFLELLLFNIMCERWQEQKIERQEYDENNRSGGMWRGGGQQVANRPQTTFTPQATSGGQQTASSQRFNSGNNERGPLSLDQLTATGAIGTIKR